MRSRQFINQDEVWEIMRDAHFGWKTTEECFEMLIELIRSAHG